MVVRNLKRASEENSLCCGDILCCVLGISSLDSEVFSKVKRPMSVSSVMKATKKSQTRVQISLQRLVDLGLLKRDGRKTKRGLKYIYSPVDIEIVKKKLLKELNSSCKRLRDEIKEI